MLYIVFMSMFYLVFLSCLFVADVLFIVLSVRSKTLRSLSSVVFVSFFFVLLYEIGREISIAFFGVPHALSLQRVRLLVFEYFLFGYFFNEVRYYVEKIRSKSL